MTPLLEIKRVPIEIEMNISHAKLEYTHGTAELEISKNNDTLHIKSKSIRLNMDRFESSGRTVSARSTDVAYKGKNNATYKATARYEQSGDLLLKAKLGQGLPVQFTQNTKEYSQVQNVNLPANNSAIDTTELNIRFEMDKLNFDWHNSTYNFEFTPGNIEISVTQQPEVIIKYIGGPIYVPPSSDPEYEPIDTRA